MRRLALLFVCLLLAAPAGAEENAPPQCDPVEHAAESGRTRDLSFACTDADDDPLAYAVASGPAHGLITDPGPTYEGFYRGSLEYHAEDGYVGPDSATVSVDDGHGGSTTVQVTIDVSPPAPPMCGPAPARTVRPGQTVRLPRGYCVNLYGADLDHEVTDGPDHGTIDQSDPDVFAYTAGPNDATDAFTFTARFADSEPVTITQTVTIAAGANAAPDCGFPGPPPPVNPLSFTLLTTQTREVAFGCSDADGDLLEVSFHEATVAGAERTSSGSEHTVFTATYDPPEGFVGTDTVGFTVADGYGGTVDGELEFIVKGADENAPPACFAGQGSSEGPRAGEERELLVTCIDAEDDPVTLEVGDTDNATVVSTRDYNDNGTRSTMAVLVHGGEPGPASVTLTPRDSEAGEPVTLRFEVRPVTANALPTCFPRVSVRRVPTGERLPVGMDELKCGDLDEDPRSYSVAVPPAHGTIVEDNEDLWVYQSQPGYTGLDVVTFEVSDGRGTVLRPLVLRVEPVGTRVDTVIDERPRRRSGDPTPTFAFRAPGHPDATFQCSRGNNNWFPCASPLTLGPLENGTHSLAVRARAGDQTEATHASYTWTVDLAPPALAEEPAAFSTSPSATFAFVGAGPFECRLDGGAYEPCASPKTYDGLTDGDHDFSVRSVGGTAEAAHSWRVLVPPAGATITHQPVGPDGGTHTAPAVKVAVPAGTAGGTVAVIDSPAPTGTPPAGYSFAGRELIIEAPVATVENPLRLTFEAEGAETLMIARDGVIVPPCTGPAGHAAPDPCVTDRTPTAIAVLSSHASKWNFAKAEPVVTVEPTVTPVPTAPVPQETPRPAPAGDRTPPVVALQVTREKLKRVKRRGLMVTVGCSETCRATVGVRRGGKVVGSRQGTGRVKVRLGRAKRVKLAVEVAAADAAGNAATKTVQLTLKR